MRVLQVISTLGVGGAERMLVNLVHCLRRAGHAVQVVAMYAPSQSPLEAELAGNGVPVTFLGKKRGFDPRMIARFARVLAASEPDVIHTHMGVLKYAFPSAAARRLPTVHTVHNLADREVEWPSRVLQYAAFRTSVVPVAIGQAVAESIRRVYRLPACRIIRNGIPVSEYAPSSRMREAVRGSLGIPPDAPTFVTVGRIDPQKDHSTLVRAFASRRLGAVGARLLLIGDGTLRHDVQRLVHELALGDRVRLLGVRSDVGRLLAAGDVFVLSSRWEGNPLSVMEAMAAGIPVVATAVGCVPELVPPGAGRLVAAGDPSALEAAMFDLASDLPQARALGAVAAAAAAASFDIGSMTRAYEALYAELIATTPARAAAGALQ